MPFKVSLTHIVASLREQNDLESQFLAFGVESFMNDTNQPIA